jgi:hypothetical protein
VSRAVAGALLATAAALGCAQPGSPPGGEVDRAPPRVVEVTPEPLDTLTDLDRPVVFRFNERISERLQGVASFREAVLISPATGEPRVDRGRSSLEVIPEGGWVADQVYRVVVLPVFRDLFGNQREVPIELVFSTGAPISETALAGFIQDRITGEVVPEARVEARAGDGARYLAVSDTGGFFALRFLPPGPYAVQAWLDQDRDWAPDFLEGQDSTGTEFEAGDTIVLELALLPRDSTPARLVRAEPVDSSKVRLAFDDYFAAGPAAGRARVFLASDSSLVTTTDRLVHSTRLDSVLAEEAAAEAARLDSIRRLTEDTIPPPADSAALAAAARDTAAADTAGAAVAGPGPEPEDTSTAAAGRPGVTRRPLPPGPPLPSRELILLLPMSLVPDTAYYVEVEDVVNIRGLPGGGGIASFRSMPPDTVPADSGAAVPPDSAGVTTSPPDTSRADRGRP